MTTGCSGPGLFRATPLDVKDDPRGRLVEVLRPAAMEVGLPLGSFEQWCKWVRDPLLALGCHDPAERVNEAKERDGRR